MGRLARDARLLATILSSDTAASLAKQLWSDSLAIAQRCRDHAFVQGIATGKLDRAAFQHYVAQDAFFLDAFARAYALCVNDAPDDASAQAFSALRAAVDGELELHRAYAVRWGVALSADPSEATAAYTEFLLRIAADEPPGHAAAAMAPCMRLYAWLGQELEAITPEFSPYREWVDTYSSAEFDAHAAGLERLVDALPTDDEAAAAHYGRAMELELAFFESALASAQG